MTRTYLLLILTFLMHGCLQAPPTIESINTDTNTSEENIASLGFNSSWYESGNYFKTINLNYNHSKISYLFGDDIQNYLKQSTNYNANYCIIASYASYGSAVKELRIKATPSFTTDFSTGKNKYYFRLATSSATGNDFCNKNILSSGASLITPGPLAFYAADVCPTCNVNLISNSVTIYQYNASSNALEVINASQIAISDVAINITTSSSSTGSNQTQTCSDSLCNNSGYDCCIANSCVNHKATIKETSQMSASELAAFNLAQAQSVSDSNWYLNYPNFYYICPNMVPNNTNSGTTNDDVDNAATASAQRIQDYYCLKELEDNSLSDPFHTNPINNSYTYTSCNTTTNTDTMYYENVLTRLYDNCGCDSAHTTLAQKITNCPNYIYSPNYKTDSFGNPTTQIESVNCFVPTDNSNLPLNETVQVNNKSAPHRYFNADGVEIDLDSDTSSITNHNQEGDPFIYLDNSYIFPQNGSFNMNSILGQMYVTLEKTLPAKKIEVGLNKKIFIETITGFYTPCPTCAKDSWFNGLLAHPSSSQGHGMQSIGHTTSRSSWGTNTSYGNYSDTHFGRACYLPPTMLPFGHTSNTDVQTQRLNRLKTQAALFVNGYQKDWYGFNKGALIGSFDGVSWFAIGNGRIITTKSKYLYLAINAPYSDLAVSNYHTVRIQDYNGVETAPEVDFDPTKTLNSPYQNQAATCQENYLCSKDSDCITKLGWEYHCADVTKIKTKWPKFNSVSSNEEANDTQSGALYQFLTQGQMPPGGNNKRCVYRGSGSLCRVDAHNITDEQKRKILTCASNFYCANISTPNVFNKEVARFGNTLESLVEPNNHLFGKDANVLGRPKNYISALSSGYSLPSDVQISLTQSALLIDSSISGQVGLCLPAKALPDSGNNNTLPEDQHQLSDHSYRTDYISQIAGCNSALFSQYRYASCPQLNSDGDFSYLTDTYINASVVTKDGYIQASRRQNSCGMESLDPLAPVGLGATFSSLEPYSAFNSIEHKDLSSSIITTGSIAANACLRRASSPCHTNLDCSPNSKHASIVDILNPTFFGNEAELNYWKEDLVCAQGTQEPQIGSALFGEYDITNNVCCREIGKSISIYSEDDNDQFEAKKLAGQNPADVKRYSRFSVVTDLVDTAAAPTNISGTANQSFTVLSAKTTDINANGIAQILEGYQWRTLNETATRTCCGGGWIRKFADGTNNWRQNRLNIDYTNFKCLTANTPLLHTDNPTTYDSSSGYYSQLMSEKAKFCSDPLREEGGCADHDFLGIAQISPPTNKPSLSTSATQETFLTYTDPAFFFWQSSLNSYFQVTNSWSNETEPFFTWPDHTTAMADNKSIKFELPSFIPINTNMKVSIVIGKDISSNKVQCTNNTGLDSNGALPGIQTINSFWEGPFGTECSGGTIDPAWCNSAGANTQCGYELNGRTLTVAFDAAFGITPHDMANLYGTADHIHYVAVDYDAPGSYAWEAANTPIGLDSTNDSYKEHRRSATPGEALYYLEKLAKFELIGIPQATFEPIYCNDNYQKVVPGLLDSSIETINDVDSHSDFITKTGSEPYTSAPVNPAKVTTSKMVSHPEIFSANDMLCCTPLGRSTTDQSKCCSGYASTIDDGSSDTSLYCMLPSGTNLNVYFNKFVSGEGMDPDIGSAYFTPDDFDPHTGYPKLQTSTYQKIALLGEDFCENAQVVRGGAFGNYEPQPSSALTTGQTVYSIVDSSSDIGNNNGTDQQGAAIFSQGYRWNHHYYCE
ncbi:MAG: hypothetical protein N4A33_03175 [Bacteriovoracaceae bacterium]|jgi:hypothetical protein|nr:hypothetical protein [Bacteriovoracaceae bacterium]